ncbi:MAG: HAD-IIA family hydrolase [Stellaceae bacterium]
MGESSQRAWPAIEGVVSDLDGVVYRGKVPIRDAIEALRDWRGRGVPICFVTNNSTHTADDVVMKLTAFGLPIRPKDVVTSAVTTARLVLDRFGEGAGVYVIGAPSLKAAILAAGLEITDTAPKAVVMGLDREITHEKLTRALRAILDGAILVGTNPDLLLPTASGFELGAGAMLTAVAAAARVRPIVVGKPETHMIELALEQLGTRREATVMVGDQLSTDVQAGKRAGLCTVLVTTGVPPVADSTLLPPDFVVDSLREIPVTGRLKRGRAHGRGEARSGPEGLWRPRSA